jgi:hypothetical protein
MCVKWNLCFSFGGIEKMKSMLGSSGSLEKGFLVLNAI